jgi:uncharacterized protein (TIGR02217 family)
VADFLEERISELVRMGASYVDDYEVEIVETSGGQEYRSLVHPFPVRKFDISYLLDTAKTYAELQAIYHRAHGRFAGFRIRCVDEWSSNGRVGTPGPYDQPMVLVSSGVYQLAKRYGTDKAAGATGYAYREIKKPVSGTVRVAIGTTEIRAADWSVVNTTGRVTFAADQSFVITGISKAAQAVLSCASHTLVAGQSIQISGVSGMTQINGLRGLVTFVAGGSVTVDINSTGFSTWTSGGVAHTRPQAGEAVTAGFEFDFPVRFNTSMPIGQDFPGHRSVDGVELIELLNP